MYFKMELRIFATCFIILIGFNFSSGAVHAWGYHHGVHPDHWKDLFPTCAGKLQSPIDIQTAKVKTDTKLGKFNFHGLSLGRDVNLELQNNGHAVQVDMTGHGSAVSGGGLPGTYVVEQFHFHWGSEDTRGSEHEINGKHFSMEMHVVMHSNRFSSVKDAMQSKNGLAVLGFLFDVGPYNSDFDEIINHLRNIEHRDDHVILKSFSLASLFPSTDCYYRYYGSLTTPMCHESVIWTLFKQHIYISESQLNQFRHLGRTHFPGSEDLINNFRNPQPINCRVVTSNCIGSYTSMYTKESKTGEGKSYADDRNSYIKNFLMKHFPYLKWKYISKNLRGFCLHLKMKFTAAVTSVFFLIGSYFANGAVPEWGYHHGVDPKHWKYLFPTCGGMQQSPIDIKTSKVQTDITLEHFDLSKLSTAKNVELGIQKDGQTVQVGLKGQGLEVSGGGLPGTYVVEQLNLHWGSKNTRGSEHEINEKHFSMEMQVVMHTDIFPSVNDAMNCTNGLAVLSFLVDIGPHNHKFDEIINHLYSIEHIGGHAQLNSFSLTSLFPSTDYFYRYYGSLTTPPCFESVIWTIFKEQIYISEFQLNQFRQLGRAHFIGTGDLINNYRFPQPLNHRVVTSNFIQTNTIKTPKPLRVKISKSKSGKKSRSRINRKSKSRSSKKSKSRSSKKSKSRRGKKSKSTRGKKSKSASGKKSNYRSSKRSNYRSSKKSKSGSGIKSQSISGLPLLTRRAYSDFNKNLFFRRRYGDSDSSD
ncbi:uncharacterized protein LOC143074129 [Mytilus galloprovincialis]|uniref:uncharacterized protein LOC143074129 n=1 Tax=Mytilus galloprovincialis TaxID=29158 RepID=UPI003F7C0B2B